MKPVQEDDIAFNHEADLLDNAMNHDQLNKGKCSGGGAFKYKGFSGVPGRRLRGRP